MESKKTAPTVATAEEILELAKKSWCSTKDLQKLAAVGQARALKIKRQIREELENKKIFIPNELYLPMDEVISYLRINLKYLKKVSEEK